MTTKRTRANALPRWQIQTVVCSAISLTASGLAWQLSDLRRDPSGLPSALDPWLARWHGLSSMLSLFAFGLVAARHIPVGLVLRKRVASGVSVSALFATLALSGFALAYLVPEPWHPTVALCHAGLGILAFALGVLHRR